MHEHLAQGIVLEGGYRGELIGRFLLTQAAYDYGFNRKLKAQRNHISLQELLTQLNVEILIGNKVRPEILESGQVHLSHWVQVQVPLTMQMTVLAYTRGAGIVCRAGTYGTDLVVPVYLGDKTELSGIKLSRTRSDGTRPIWAEENKIEYEKVCKLFSAVFVQVKNSKNSTVADEDIKNSTDDMRIHAHVISTPEGHTTKTAHEKMRQMSPPVPYKSCVMLYMERGERKH